MTQLDADQYLRLTPPITYGQSDGLFYDQTNDKLVLVIGDAVVFSVDTAGAIEAGALEAPDLNVASQARGDLLRRGASSWERVAAKTSGQVMLGDGTDVISAALSGHVSSVSAAGAVTLAFSGDGTLDAGGALTIADPTKVRSTTVNIGATEIVGTDAGDLGHASGVTLVAAVASKIIEPLAVVINYTFDTAAYTDGGDVSVEYDGGAAATGVASAANSFGDSASNINILRPLSGLGLVNTALVLVAASAFTDPGTAAGTAAIKTYYRLIDA